jgi:hypothetical protein
MGDGEQGATGRLGQWTTVAEVQVSLRYIGGWHQANLVPIDP